MSWQLPRPRPHVFFDPDPTYVGNWRCVLCRKCADDSHVASDTHKDRVKWWGHYIEVADHPRVAAALEREQHELGQG